MRWGREKEILIPDIPTCLVNGPCTSEVHSSPVVTGVTMLTVFRVEWLSAEEVVSRRCSGGQRIEWRERRGKVGQPGKRLATR